jgi:hypothetical protein
MGDVRLCEDFLRFFVGKESLQEGSELRLTVLSFEWTKDVRNMCSVFLIADRVFGMDSESKCKVCIATKSINL